jgi:hypothetical protein
VKKYAIARFDTANLNSFVEGINFLLERGWELYGFPTATDRFIMQALVQEVDNMSEPLDLAKETKVREEEEK